MTYDEFYEAVKQTYSYVYAATINFFSEEDYRYWENGDETRYEVRHDLSGASGGSCWGSEAEYWISRNPCPTIDLSKLFEKVCPKMSCVVHNKVMDGLVREEHRTDFEYYGNYTDYVIKSVNYRALYDALVRNGVF